jgi:hypothetical protein
MTYPPAGVPRLDSVHGYTPFTASPRRPAERRHRRPSTPAPLGRRQPHRHHRPDRTAASRRPADVDLPVSIRPGPTAGADRS